MVDKVNPNVTHHSHHSHHITALWPPHFCGCCRGCPKWQRQYCSNTNIGHCRIENARGIFI